MLGCHDEVERTLGEGGRAEGTGSSMPTALPATTNPGVRLMISFPLAISHAHASAPSPMPLVPFSELPDDARVWVFGAAAPMDGDDAKKLLVAVDGFLPQWKAHGHPLTCAREWRDDRFLVIGVDQRTEGASGCSVDDLFRLLQSLEAAVGTSLLGGGRVFFRDSLGLMHGVSRAEFAALARSGNVTSATRVFDTTVTSMAGYRTAFEGAAGERWHRTLLSPG